MDKHEMTDNGFKYEHCYDALDEHEMIDSGFKYVPATVDLIQTYCSIPLYQMTYG